MTTRRADDHRHHAIEEHELHALVDGRLPAERCAEAEAWLERHPEQARRVAAWRRQNAAIAALFGGVEAEPVPERLRPQAVLAARRLRRRRVWLPLAASVVMLAVGAAGGWWARGLLPPDAGPPAPAGGGAALAQPRLADAALAAHRVYAVEVRHPVEVPADQEQHLVAWLSKRLGHGLRAPDLGAAGFALVGGRLLPAAGGGPAAQFMYEDALGRRLTLYAARNPAGRDTAFRYRAEGGLSAFYWLDGPLGWALIGELDRTTLLDLAHRVYRQLEG